MDIKQLIPYMFPAYSVYKLAKGDHPFVQMAKGLEGTDNEQFLGRLANAARSIPFIGEFIPEYIAAGRLTDSDIREAVNRAYQVIGQLNSKDQKILNKLNNLLIEYAGVTGSQSLVNYIKSRKDQIQDQISSIESKMNQRDTDKQVIDITANDLLQKQQFDRTDESTKTFGNFTDKYKGEKDG